MFLEWSGSSDEVNATYGVDTFASREGEIGVQTIHYAVHCGPSVPTDE